MERVTHDLTELFQQLGLPDDPKAIDRFISDHRPVPPELAIADAPFWSDPQRALLREAVDDDADWAVVVDQLSNSLH